ncbi:GTP cyclohydrolase II [Sphingomonas sp. F9_3S_D5_B_2]
MRHAIAALRAGRPVWIDSAAPVTVLSVETATPELLELLDADRSARLLITGERAAALALGNMRDAADAKAPVLVAREEWLNVETALALADPGRDLGRGLIGPLHPLPLDCTDSAAAAVKLATAAGLLPALWVLAEPVAQAAVSAAEALGSGGAVQLLTRAKLPVEGLPDTQIVVFRSVADGQEHVALVVGAFGGKPPLARLHSECLTGDVFGSLKCDCGPQLREALHILGENGGGILLYLRQEGRGIGLANKIRAYALQDRGLDTVDANRRLGFADDERGYADAAAMLRAIGVDRVRLLTNNPSKVAGLEAAGVSVMERVAHHMPANPHNADYLATKRKRSGHLA